MATKKNTAIKNGDKEYNYFRIVRTIGHEWKDGKKIPIRKQFYGSSKGDAEKQFRAYQEEQLQKKYEKEHAAEKAQLKTFGEYAEEYTYGVLPASSYAHGTKIRYEESYRVHIKKTWIANMPIREIDALTIQSFYEQLEISRQTLKSINKWMSAFFRWLALNKYAVNPMPSVTLPDKPDNSRHNEIIVWEPDEIQTILISSDDYRLRFMMFLMNYTGLRISECLGLKYSDIHDGFVYVNQQYYEGKVVPPKYGSYRKLPVHPELEKALAVHKKRFSVEAEKNHYETEFVFTTKVGALLDHRNVRRSLNRYYDRIGVPEKSPHTYRATFCTELCRAGVPLEVASKLMGHKSIEVTAKHYALVKQDVQIDAINRLPSVCVKKVLKPKESG